MNVDITAMTVLYIQSTYMNHIEQVLALLRGETLGQLSDHVHFEHTNKR